MIIKDIWLQHVIQYAKNLVFILVSRLSKAKAILLAGLIGCADIAPRLGTISGLPKYTI
jgi:hypothetical protein